MDQTNLIFFGLLCKSLLDCYVEKTRVKEIV